MLDGRLFLLSRFAREDSGDASYFGGGVGVPPSERFDWERDKDDVFALACFEGLSVLPTSGNFQGVSGNGGGSVDCGTLKRVNNRD